MKTRTEGTFQRNAAILYLSLQGSGAIVWWALLLASPAFRRYFLPSGCPDVMLLAFGVADGLLFVGLSFGAAIALIRERSWAWPLLCVHAGAAMYAALYCVTLTLLTHGQAIWGTVLMLPALIVPASLAWKLRPGGQS